MSRFSWIRRAKPKALVLSEDQQRRLAELPVAQEPDERPLDQQRLIVLDLETTGLDMKRDQVLALGAVVIDHGGIDLSRQFDVTLKSQGRPLQDSVLVHGLAPSTLAAGLEPAEGLLAFMAFLGDSPLLAFHAEFDQRMLARALETTLGYHLQHTFIDVAELAPMLYPEAAVGHRTLDDWAGLFGLKVLQRHHAAADALVTAELALILLSRAQRQGMNSLIELQQRLLRWRRKKNAPAF